MLLRNESCIQWGSVDESSNLSEYRRQVPMVLNDVTKKWILYKSIIMVIIHVVTDIIIYLESLMPYSTPFDQNHTDNVWRNPWGLDTSLSNDPCSYQMKTIIYTELSSLLCEVTSERTTASPPNKIIHGTVILIRLTSIKLYLHWILFCIIFYSKLIN